MQIIRPDYFDRFHCAGGACPDSCCKEWEIQVDDASAGYYRSLPGQLGDRLREVLRTEDGQTVMTILDGRCPMWRTDGLCRIQAELGEAALCKTCREFPRLTHDYGDFRELGLELSCPEAAKLILCAAPAAPITVQLPGGETPEYDADAMALLKATRPRMLSLLSDSSRPVGEALALGLLYGCQVQAALDGGDMQAFDAEAALSEARALAQSGSPEKIPAFFLGLELLTSEWEVRLRAPAPAAWNEHFRALARYLVQRYWLQAVADYDLYSRVKFVVIACLLVKQLGGDLQRTAQLFSKEIENDAENLDAVLDAAYSCPAFADDRMLGMLLLEDPAGGNPPLQG